MALMALKGHITKPSWAIQGTLGGNPLKYFGNPLRNEGQWSSGSILSLQENRGFSKSQVLEIAACRSQKRPQNQEKQQKTPKIAISPFVGKSRKFFVPRL